MGAGLGVLANQPIAVFALHGNAVQDHGLATADHRADPFPVKCPGQVEIDRRRGDGTGDVHQPATLAKSASVGSSGSLADMSYLTSVCWV